MKLNERYEILREVISDFIDAGKTNKVIVNKLHMSPSTVKKVKRLKNAGKVLKTTKRSARHKSARTEEIVESACLKTETPIRTNIAKFSRELEISEGQAEDFLKRT